MKKFLKLASIKIRYYIVGFLSWLMLKPAYFAVTILNLFLGFVANKKTRLLHDIAVYEIQHSVKLFPDTGKRAPAWVSKSSEVVEDESQAWYNNPTVKRLMENAKRRSEELRKTGRISSPQDEKLNVQKIIEETSKEVLVKEEDKKVTEIVEQSVTEIEPLPPVKKKKSLPKKKVAKKPSKKKKK